MLLKHSLAICSCCEVGYVIGLSTRLVLGMTHLGTL